MNVDLGEARDPDATYNLSGLMHRDFEFPLEPDDGIEQIAVKHLKLWVMGREHRSIAQYRLWK